MCLGALAFADRWFRLSTIDLPFLNSRPASFCLLLLNDDFKALVEDAVCERRRRQKAGVEGGRAETELFGVLWKCASDQMPQTLDDAPFSLPAEAVRRLGVSSEDPFQWRVVFSAEERRGETTKIKNEKGDNKCVWLFQAQLQRFSRWLQRLSEGLFFRMRKKLTSRRGALCGRGVSLSYGPIATC